jgi:hypothetical protein
MGLVAVEKGLSMSRALLAVRHVCRKAPYAASAVSEAQIDGLERAKSRTMAPEDHRGFSHFHKRFFVEREWVAFQVGEAIGAGKINLFRWNF